MNKTLPREYQRAYSVFQQHWPNIHQYSQTISIYDELLPSGYVASAGRPFDKFNLPKQAHWDWAQSSARATVPISSKASVTFRKMNARRKFNHIDPPSFKVWTFEIKIQGFTTLYFIWCEKGVEKIGNGIITEIGPIFPEQLSVNDLSFLAPYCDQETAEELGWL